MSDRVCCEGARRIQRDRDDDTTLIGYDCPVHGLTPTLRLAPDMASLLRELLLGSDTRTHSEILDAAHKLLSELPNG